LRRYVELRQHIEFIEEAECDEIWSFVGSKAQQRWLWYAIDHATGKILAYVLGSRKDKAFIKLGLLEVVWVILGVEHVEYTDYCRLSCIPRGR
jgi:IS1 family transposase